MDYDTFHRRVVGALDARLDSMPRGTKKAICDELGVRDTWFSDLRRGVKAIPMRRLVKVLDILGEHPGDFIYRATRQDHMPELPEPTHSEPDPDLARLIELASKRLKTR